MAFGSLPLPLGPTPRSAWRPFALGRLAVDSRLPRTTIWRRQPFRRDPGGSHEYLCLFYFAETKEQLGGFLVIEARDLNDAVRVASTLPPARLGSIEVRPIAELTHP
jgi:hypothetical protein